MKKEMSKVGIDITADHVDSDVEFEFVLGRRCLFCIISRKGGHRLGFGHGLNAYTYTTPYQRSHASKRFVPEGNHPSVALYAL